MTKLFFVRNVFGMHSCPLSILVFVLFAMSLMLPLNIEAQTLIVPNNDSSFVKEYRNDDEFGVSAKNGFVVSLGNKFIKDDYGKFYQLSIIVQNLTPNSYTFDPDSVKAYVLNSDSLLENMKVYTSKGFQKKIKNQQAWEEALTGLAVGLNAGQAGYQTSYVSTTGYGGYTYLQPVTTYNAGAAALANMVANNQMVQLANQMEADRKVRAEGYLTKNTIHSGEGIYGYMNVKRIKGKIMTVVIPVNGTQFVFKWDISKKK